MSFSEMVQTYEASFQTKGECVLRPGEALETCVQDAGVPHAPGVFVVYGRRGDADDVLYVGKAGTLRNDGRFTSQKLDGGLLMKQNGKLRTRLWPRWIEEKGLDALVIRWFVTVDKVANVLPSKAEADLLQAWYDETGELPPENREA